MPQPPSSAETTLTQVSVASRPASAHPATTAAAFSTNAARWSASLNTPAGTFTSTSTNGRLGAVSGVHVGRLGVLDGAADDRGDEGVALGTGRAQQRRGQPGATRARPSAVNVPRVAMTVIGMVSSSR